MSQSQQQSGAPASDASSPHHLEQQRRANRDAIAALGAKPYGTRTDNIISLAAARALFDESAEDAFRAAEKHAKDSGSTAPVADNRPRAKVAGRIVLKRDGGKLIWMQLRDHTTAAKRDTPEGLESSDDDGASSDEPRRAHPLPFAPDLQIAISKKDCAEPGFDVAKNLDLGDVVVIEGPIGKTNRGEVTLWARSLTIGAKSLVPPPEKWSGLQDLELRYRRRYVDMYANPESMHVFKQRSQLVAHIRKWLAGRGYFEVETPMLQVQAGGAAARPFITHMNALSIDLYLRIAPELFLKRLLVGGMPKVFEINRNFRNEGLDKQHNPEFTMLELYHAFGDVEVVMEMTESLVRDCARFIASEQNMDPRAMPYGDIFVDYESPFDRITYAELFQRGLGFAMHDTSRVRKEAESRGLTAKYLKHLAEESKLLGAGAAKSAIRRAEDIDPLLLVNELFEEVAEPSLNPGKPTWIMKYPAALSPLTRPNPDDPTVADRSDLFIGHMEIGPHYTELNDPDVQAEKFRQQLTGLDDEESTFRTFDEDFVNALKVGMPPAGGMGMGIDRLCMLLLNQRTIRDVILFPMMRPEG